MLRKVRTTLAVLMFVGVTLLFMDFTGTLHHFLGWMAKIQFLPAVLSLNVLVIVGLCLLTLVFGRIYCSIICPLGIMQDLVAWAHNQKKKRRYAYSAAKSVMRYVFLGIMLLSIVAGLGSLTALLAPYSAYGRMASNLLQPLYLGLNNLLALGAEHVNSYTFYSVDVWLRSLPTFVIALASFIFIVVLAWRNGRTYCNTICPVGTTLSFLARVSWFKVRIDEKKCVKCSLCTKNCKAACIDFKNHKIDYSRCVVCGDCIEVCPKKAIDFVHLRPKAENKKDTTTNTTEIESKGNIDENRRRFVTTLGSVVTATALAQAQKKVDGGLAKIEDKIAPERQTPITPPGSLSARNLARHCTGCQLCVAECPNQVLRPSTSLVKLMQPTMSYERGYCRPECTRCSQVCPAGAIRPITRGEKSAIQIGHAVWIGKNCLPNTRGIECGNCARHCPSGAISMVHKDPADETSPLIPIVNEERCIGCGACENLCPTRPFSAIYVEGHENHRNI